MKQPAIFIGHGSPLNVLQTNSFTQTLKEWGKELQLSRPQAILCISAHWFVNGTYVSEGKKPRQIYDFGGFPPELSKIVYPVPGSEELGAKVMKMNSLVTSNSSWGIDHGTWSVLYHLFPEASIPTVQLSIHDSISNQEHWNIGASLLKLREEGVLIIGSGNIVHSFFGFRGPQDAPPDPRGVEFDSKIASALIEGDAAMLTNYEKLPHGSFSAPTPDHYLPILYVASLRQRGEPITFKYEGFQYASMSMRSFQIG